MPIAQVKPLFILIPYSQNPHGANHQINWILQSCIQWIRFVKNQKAKDELLEDLLTRKHIEKIFIVTWTDIRHDYDLLADYVDRTVIYDAEEEDAAYHQRVIEIATRRY